MIESDQVHINGGLITIVTNGNGNYVECVADWISVHIELKVLLGGEVDESSGAWESCVCWEVYAGEVGILKLHDYLRVWLWIYTFILWLH